MTDRWVGLILPAPAPAAPPGSPEPGAVGPFHPILGTTLLGLVARALARSGASAVAAVVRERPTDGRREPAAAGVPDGTRIVLLPDSGADGDGWAAALRAARREIRDPSVRDVLVVSHDLPLLEPAWLRPFLRQHRSERNALTLLVPEGSEERAAAAIFAREELLALLTALSRRPGFEGSGLDPFVEAAVLREKRVGAYRPAAGPAALRVRDLETAARAAAILRERKASDLCRSGVSVLDPASAWIDLDVEVGAGTVLYPSVVIEGATRIGRDCWIYPHVHIRNAVLGDRVRVLGATVVEDCAIEEDVHVGPFSRLRPKTVLKPGSRVGNFVEMKNTVFGPGSKAQHLSYLGDSTVGDGVNVGAGTITCNYDGVRKNPTVIGAGAFIGSGTELVAPVTIGPGAYVAAGSTITKDVAPDALAVARERQVEKPGWAAARRRRIAEEKAAAEAAGRSGAGRKPARPK